jgi:hypothetical protein
MDLHEQAIRLGYSVRTEADGTSTVLANGDVVKGDFGSRAQAWGYAESLAYAGVPANRISWSRVKTGSKVAC